MFITEINLFGNIISFSYGFVNIHRVDNVLYFILFLTIIHPIYILGPYKPNICTFNSKSTELLYGHEIPVKTIQMNKTWKAYWPIFFFSRVSSMKYNTLCIPRFLQWSHRICFFFVIRTEAAWIFNDEFFRIL